MKINYTVGCIKYKVTLVLLFMVSVIVTTQISTARALKLAIAYKAIITIRSGLITVYPIGRHLKTIVSDNRGLV